MNKIQIAWKTAVKFVDKNLPHFLTGMALVGLGTSVGSAIKETPKAEKELINAKIEKAYADDLLDIPEKDAETNELMCLEVAKEVKLTPWESFKILAPIYWPCAVSVLLTGACIISADVVHTKRFAAVVAALGMSEKHLKEYQDKVKELFGEKKEEQVQKEIAKDYALACPENAEKGYVVGQMYPCCLEIAGLYWVSDRKSIERAFNEWNRKGLKESGEIYLDELIVELGIDVKDAWLYSHTSWDITSGKLVDPVIEGGETFNGVPCLTVRMSRYPDAC